MENGDVVMTDLLPYFEIRKRLQVHPLILEEISTSHAVSLPLPTLRWGLPAWLQWAAPAVRRPGSPVIHSPPDQWWAVDAVHGRMILFAKVAVWPIPGTQDWEPETLPTMGISLMGYKAQLAGAEQCLASLAPVFLTRQSGEPAEKAAGLAALRVYLPVPLQRQYRAIAADFFDWLEGS